MNWNTDMHRLVTDSLKKNVCTTFERNKLFVQMEKFWDILFQLMKHGTNIFYVVIMYGNIL